MSVAILRAGWANLVAGRVVQGGSTLTQQLVKNLFLDRGQSFVRKANEALIALLIELRYDKRRILEAYVNEIFLGQQGGQAVHGFAAASEFYFGREVDALSTRRHRPAGRPRPGTEPTTIRDARRSARWPGATSCCTSSSKPA